MADDLAAPEPVDPPFAAPERTTLESWLEFHRASLLLACDGLSDEQRKRRPVATSLMSLHGMVRPMAGVERDWFQRAQFSLRWIYSHMSRSTPATMGTPT